jgi:glycosyltransferase involved in cell wall biosynthesis
MRCYPCLGFINRSNNWTKIKVSSLRKLQQEQKLNSKLHGFIVASEYMKQHLELHKFDSKKIFVNPLYSWKSNAENKVVETSNYFLFAGQLLRGKGVDIALEAMKFLPQDVMLYIAGRGRQEAEFKKLCRKLDIEHKVKFLGFIEQDKLQKLYSESLCLIMPSRVPETFGLSGLEAMSFSKPVIASHVGGIGQWLRNGYNGILLKNNTATELSVAMLDLFKNQQKAAEMGKKGNELYMKEFQAENHIKPLAEYFSKIISGGHDVK